MADTGAISPGTMADDAAVGAVAWSNPDNAKTSNDVYATATLGKFTNLNSHYLMATNFGFAVPAGATIDGIVLAAEIAVSQIVYDYIIKLVKGGAVTGDDKARFGTPWSGPDNYVSWGAANVLWGIALTAEDVNAANFGAVISIMKGSGGALSNIGYVDHMRITVYYTAGGAPAAASIISRRMMTGVGR
jgi:hypothetical protein